MAEENDSFLHRIPYTGPFKDIADWLNTNFRLIELAIKQNTGKSAYEVWRDYTDGQGNQPNIDKTEEEFLASLKESGYKMQAVTVRPSAIANIAEDTIYLYPDGTGQWSSAIYTGDLSESYDSTKWIVLATNIGDLSEAFADIQNLFAMVGHYECSTAADTAVKTVSATGYVLTNGGNIRIKMEYANTASSNVKLQIGSETAKDLYYNGEAVTNSNTWEDGETVVVYYDGTYYQATSSYGKNPLKEAVVSGSNLFNPNLKVSGYLDNNGNITGVGGTYYTSDFIAVDTSKSYTLYGSQKTSGVYYIRYVCFYNSSKQKVGNRNIDVNALSTSDFPEGTAYIRCSDTFSKDVGVFEGANAPYEVFYLSKHVEYESSNGLGDKTDDELVVKQDIALPVAKINELYSKIGSSVDDFANILELLTYEEDKSTNILNPSDTVVGYLNGSGNINSASAGANYETSQYINVEGSTQYHFYHIRWIEFYDDNGYISSANGGYNNNGAIGDFNFTSPSGAKKVRVSTNLTEMASAGIFKTPFSEYEPYYFFRRLKYAGADISDKAATELAVKRDLAVSSQKNITLSYVPSTAIDKYILTDGKVTIQCSFDKNKETTYESHIFNFLAAVNAGVSSSNNDDVAPMHMRGTTLAGNHNYPCYTLTIASHGLTDSDLGATMTSGDYQFVLMRIDDENTIVVCRKMTDENDYVANHSAVGNALSYNGNTYTYTASSSGWLFPSVKNQSQRVIIDGVEGTVSDSRKAAVVDFSESYELMNIKSVQENLADDGTYTGDALLHVDNIYRFLDDMTVLVISNWVFLQQSLRFQDIMFNQAAVVSTNKSTSGVYYYAPGSKPFSNSGNSMDFSSLSAYSNIYGSSGGYFFDSDHTEDGKNVSRIIQKNGNCIFALGFLPVEGTVGAALNNYTDTTFEIRGSSGKIYPHGVNSAVKGTTINKGDAYSCVMYRKFLDARDQATGHICMYSIEHDGVIYVYIDYSATMVDHIDLDDNRLNGKAIDVIEQLNASLMTTIYNGGFYINATSVTGHSCYCIVKIKL